MSSSESKPRGNAGRVGSENEPELLPGYTSHSLYTGCSQRGASFAAFDAALQHRDFLLPKITDPVTGALPTEDELVLVPWWILNVIANGWKRYKDPDWNASVGKAFELESSEKGKRPAKQEFAKKVRDQSLALNVIQLRKIAKAEKRTLSLENAFAEVAEITDTSEDIVRLAYKSINKIR